MAKASRRIDDYSCENVYRFGQIFLVSTYANTFTVVSDTIKTLSDSTKAVHCVVILWLN